MELFTAAEVGSKLRLSESTIWNWQYGRKAAPAGFPPPVKMCGAVRWRSTDICNFIESLPFTDFGRIKPTEQQLSAITKASTGSFVTAPVRGRGRPRKVALLDRQVGVNL